MFDGRLQHQTSRSFLEKEQLVGSSFEARKAAFEP
jgi:hypothetical protein